MSTGIELLQKQIHEAKQMLDSRPVKSPYLAAWNNRAQAYLIQIYGEDSPNIDTIIEASGEAPAWVFMPDEVAERYEAGRLEDKMQKLEECVAALKHKAGKA